MRTLLASLLFSTILFGASPASAAGACPDPLSPLALFDRQPDVMRVRVVPGSAVPGDGGIEYKFEVLETLRGSTRVGVVLEGSSGGPCARTLVEGAEYVLALGQADNAGTGRINAGVLERLPTSLALQTAIAKTRPDDEKGRAALIYKAANARTATKADQLSILAYLVERADLVAKLTPAQCRRLDALFADAKKVRPDLGEAWTKLTK